MNGLCVSITPEGKLKRHLSVKNREVPLEDTTVGNELILFVEERPLKTLAFLELYHSEDHFKLLSCVDSYLKELDADDPVCALLTRTLIADKVGKYKHTPDPEKTAEALMPHLMEPWHMELVINDVLNTLSTGHRIAEQSIYPLLCSASCIITYSVDDESDFRFLFRSVTQYYTFLIQRFLMRKPNVARCELCGKFFLPKTKRRTLYCDRIIRDGKTCKQIGPYLKRKELARFNHVVSEFNHAKDRLLRRLERTGYGKKPSPIDLTEWQYLSWLEKATLARDQFLTGKISENEALSIIHVPTKKEMMSKESADCALDFSFASSYCD